MKTKTILFVTISVLLLATFFFKVIPIPVNSIDGVEQDRFIFGGFYWTSILYQLSVHSISALFLSLMFVTLFLGVYLMEFE